MPTKLASNIQPPITVELMGKVAEYRSRGIDVIGFNIGEPDFNTPENIRNKAKEALDIGFTHYTAIAGITELRKAICRKLWEDNHIHYDPSEICVGTGAKQPLADAIFTLVEEGDEIILLTPCWVSYAEIIKMSGARMVPVACQEKQGFDLDIDAIQAAITPKTKALLMNTPNNPTGAVYSKERLCQLADLALKHDFYIIADEIYEKLVYGDAIHFSIASVSEAMKQRCVTINGFSKAYAMTGWRIGYAAAPKEIIKGISNIQSQTTSACSSISQYAAVEALNGPQESVKTMCQEFDRRRRYISQRLNAMNGIVCPPVNGAFYVLPNVSGLFGRSDGEIMIRSSMDLADYLLENAHICVVPGSEFFAEGYLRLSYATSMDQIREGMDRMEAAINHLR